MAGHPLLYVSCISIHAPTKGATISVPDVDPVTGISIHAPTKGATQLHFSDNRQSHKFQSTLPRRERPVSDLIKILDTKISIHAPTKGATDSSGERTVRVLFQSTLPRRERLHCVCGYITKITISIHAPTKGATQCN